MESCTDKSHYQIKIPYEAIIEETCFVLLTICSENLEMMSNSN